MSIANSHVVHQFPSHFSADRSREVHAMQGAAAQPEPRETAAPAALRLAVQGLDAEQLSILDAILRVVGERTVRRWELCDGFEGDLLLTTRAMPRPRSDGLTALLLREDDAACGPDELCLQAPLRVMAVLDLLNSAHDRLRRAQTVAPVAATPITREHEAIEGDDGRSLAGALARLIGSRPELTLRVRIVGFGTLYLCLKSKIHHCDFPFERLPEALNEHRFVMTTIPATSAELVVRMDAARPADEALWQIGLVSALDKPFVPGAAFRLQRWPDFARLPHRPEYIRLCAAMTRTHQSADALVALSGLRRCDIDHLLHACALCGWLDAATGIDAPAVAPPTSASGIGGLFDRLRRRFGL